MENVDGFAELGDSDISGFKTVQGFSPCIPEYIKNFTCNCGRQKYDRHHLCKHLVQAFQHLVQAFQHLVQAFQHLVQAFQHLVQAFQHLVQAFQHPPSLFFSQVIRRRVLPIYQHPKLKLKNTEDSPFTFNDFDGSITDGDDHIWSGDQDILRGGGGWRQLAGSFGVLGKRRAVALDQDLDTRAENLVE
ncbi:hypothetical protein C0995_002320, partial [Termitomyces sp. Mi166